MARSPIVSEGETGDRATVQQPGIKIYDAGRAQSLPGRFIADKIIKANATKDISCVGAWTLADYYSRFLHDVLNRDSLDNKDFSLNSTVHFMRNYSNAFWTGGPDGQMVYGDGDGVNLTSFSTDPSVVFHELSHGLIQYTCNLDYQGQSGALNESCADVFASIVMQWLNYEDVNQASWLIGELCVVGDKYSLRSMLAPGTAYVNHPVLGTDPQPPDMSRLYTGQEDNGGVHINSGIPNRAFALFAKAVGGFSWKTPCSVWYRTISTPGRISPSSDFTAFARGTIQSAKELYGENSSVVAKLISAWNTVKVPL